MDQSNQKSPKHNDDARPPGLVPRLALILSAAIGATSLTAFAVFLFTGPWKILVLFTDTSAVLTFDLFLSIAFFVQHSGMIRQSFRAWSRKFAPTYYDGAIFSIISGIFLYCVILFWQVSEQTIAIANESARLGMRALFFTAFGGIVWSNVVLRSFDSFGLQAIRCHLRGKKQPGASFMVRGPYRWVRHPQYFFILVMIWSYPDLTADRLLLNVVWSTWLVVGTLLEERDLAKTFGNRYKEFQSRVPMLIPYRVPR